MSLELLNSLDWSAIRSVLMHPAVFAAVLFAFILSFVSVVVYLAKIDTRSDSQRALDRMNYMTRETKSRSHCRAAYNSNYPSGPYLDLEPESDLERARR